MIAALKKVEAGRVVADVDLIVWTAPGKQFYHRRAGGGSDLPPESVQVVL
jgi:hypothetical protein